MLTIMNNKQVQLDPENTRFNTIQEIFITSASCINILAKTTYKIVDMYFFQ